MQLNTDRVVSLSAMLVGLGSLFIIVYQTALLSKSGADKAIIDVTYRSVYGDRWRVTSDKVVPEPL